MNRIVNIAAYKYVDLDELNARRIELRDLTRRLELRGTILLSHEGINMFLAGTRDGIDSLLTYVKGMHPDLSDLTVKESLTDYQPFHRMLVKIKKEIIPVGIGGRLEISTSEGTTFVEPIPDTAPKLKPAELKQWLDEGRDIALLDTRNDYETDLGTFENAIDLRLKTFRDFPKAAASLPDDIKKKPVVMFCTGGIRCEKIGPYMKGLGFEAIYQLDGGILKYFEDCQQSHYQGDCFVFDKRVALNSGLAPSNFFECFACKHVLTQEEVRSTKYKEGVSCPYCYRDPVDLIKEQQSRIDQIAAAQLGCQPYENRRWISIARKQAGKPLFEALFESFPAFGQAAWKSAIEAGYVQCPRRAFAPARADEITIEGQRFLHVMPEYVEPPVSQDIKLVWQDEAIVVVSKGAPLPVHPSGRFNKNTLLAILDQAYYPQHLRPCHRLDSNTTGLVVLARRHKFAQNLQMQFRRGTVKKRYLVRVLGIVPWDEQDCKLAIAPEPLPSGGRQLCDSGMIAETRFRVLYREANSSVLEAELVTGRTHQIRIHAAALGHPIQNDPLYLEGGASRSQPDEELSRRPMGLHAWELQFHHPITSDTVTYQSHPPVSFGLTQHN